MSDTYRCTDCNTIGGALSFSAPEDGRCDTCLGKESPVVLIRALIGPYLTRSGNSDVGNLARAIRDVLKGTGL